MHNKYTEAVSNDNRIQACVMYTLSEGLTKQIKDDDALFRKFKEFKGLVRRGSMTIEQLENMVYTLYGITSENSENNIEN